MANPQEVTALLHAAEQGNPDAMDELFDLVYAELKSLAKGQRARWSGDHTLNTTVLVHEAYIKLVDQSQAKFSDRAHFLAVAARAMRHILVNYAERQQAAKRGGGKAHVELDAANPVSPEAAEDVIALNSALNRLAEVNERQAQVVETRFFGGFSIDETAGLLGISPATVKRDWALASAWLHREIQKDLGGMAPMDEGETGS